MASLRQPVRHPEQATRRILRIMDQASGRLEEKESRATPVPPGRGPERGHVPKAAGVGSQEDDGREQRQAANLPR